MKNRQSFVFTVTTGRTGTTLLTELLGQLPGVVATHEPEPGFHEVMRPAQTDPLIFVEFWKKKLTVIGATGSDVYVETSNVFSKGFLPTLLRMGIKPKLIFLNRSPRKIALSLLSRKSIPGVSSSGLKYSASPNDPMTLPLSESSWTNYQRCYWAAIDMLYKQFMIKAMFEDTLEGIFELTTKQITDFATFSALVQFICPKDHPAKKIDQNELAQIHTRTVATLHNPNPVSLSERNVENIDHQEAELLHFINFYFPTPSHSQLHRQYEAD